MITDEALAKLTEDAWRAHVALAIETMNARMLDAENAMREARSELFRLLAARPSGEGACPDDPDGLHHVGCGCENSDVFAE